MPRTHAWMLHPGSPLPRGWFARFLWWIRTLWAPRPAELTGTVDLTPLEALGVAVERRLGKRYRCLAVIPRSGPTLDEAQREIVSGDRVVLIPPLDTDTRSASSLRKRAERILRERKIPMTHLSEWSDQGYLLEGRSWCQRMQCIFNLKSEGSPDAVIPAPPLFQSPDFQAGLVEAIRQAERSAGWTVPEDWIREAVTRAWKAIDEGLSIDDATTLPEPTLTQFSWLDSVLTSTESEDA